MKILKILIIVTLLLFPARAQAAITIDFGAILAQIKTITINIKIKVDAVKTNVTSWKMVKAIGDAVKGVSDFFKNLKEEYEIRKAKYDKWKADINKLKSDAEAYYFSALDVYSAALDMAEQITELGARFAAYLEEGQSIIKDAGDTVKMCASNLKELISVVKHLKEQVQEASDNIRYYRERRDQIKKEYDAMANNVQGSSASQTVKKLRLQLEEVSEQYNNAKGLHANLKQQYYNHLASQRNLVDSCVYNVKVLKARIRRLTCNMTEGEIKGFEDKMNNLAISVNNWNSQLEEIERDTIKIEADKCVPICIQCDQSKTYTEDGEVEEDEDICGQCEECKPVFSKEAQGLISINPIPNGSPACEQQMSGLTNAVNDKTCVDYKNICISNPQSDACLVSCGSMCSSISPSDPICCNMARIKCNYGSVGYCHLYSVNCASDNNNDECYSLKKQCDKDSAGNGSSITPSSCRLYQTKCGGKYSFKHSISNSLPIASAKVSFDDLNSLKGGMDEDSAFLLPNNLVICCELSSDDVKSEGALYDCLTKFNRVIYSSSGDNISEKDKYFFQCLRKEIGNPDFESKIKASDSTKAGAALDDAYAEYLSAAYLEAMKAYNDSFYYKDEQIDNTANTANEDAQSAWAVVVDMNMKLNNRINEIAKIWTREQSIKTFENVRNYRMIPGGQGGGANGK